MPDIDDLIGDRLRRMPLLVWVCVVLGVTGGAVLGVVLAVRAGPVGNLRAFVLGLGCSGFVVGLAVGCTLHTVLRRRDDKKPKRRRKRRSEPWEE